MPPIHRTVKNVIKNYSYAEVKVREATSNDPWGPSTSLMAEIAELTYDIAACVEIMAMVWKRINDHGKNWRHVYKALVLLEHLVRYGQEMVVTQAKESIVCIKTLRDFQHLEDGKDQGHSVRERARQLVGLVEDDEKLRAERVKAGKSRDRFGAHASYGLSERPPESTSYISPSAVTQERYSPASASTPHSYTASSAHPQSYSATSAHPQSYSASASRPAATTARVKTDIDAVRPTSENEEDLQLQMALAISKEQHEEEEKLRKGDEIKLQMAIEESKKTAQREYQSRSHYVGAPAYATPTRKPADASLNRVLDDPWSAPAYSQPITALRDPWGAGNAEATPAKEPWELGATSGYSNGTGAASFGAGQQSYGAQPKADDEFSEISSRYRDPQLAKTRSIESWLDSSAMAVAGGKEENLWNDSDGAASDLSDDVKAMQLKATENNKKKVTPEQFLGAHAKLVDFDDLVSKPTPASTLNPFAITIGKSSPASNPFVVKAQEEERSKRVPLNQLQPSLDSSYPPGGIAPGPTVAPVSWPTAAVEVVYTSQPAAQASMQGVYNNPFL